MSGSCTRSLGAESDSSALGEQLWAWMPQETIHLFQRDTEFEGEVEVLPGLGLLFGAFSAANRGVIDTQRFGQSLLGVADDDARWFAIGRDDRTTIRSLLPTAVTGQHRIGTWPVC